MAVSPLKHKIPLALVYTTPTARRIKMATTARIIPRIPPAFSPPVIKTLVHIQKIRSFLPRKELDGYVDKLTALLADCLNPFRM